MSTHKDLVREAASLWTQKKKPSGRTPRRAMHLAEKVGLDPNAPAVLRSMAWVIVADVYETLGWELPSSPGLGVCHGAAVSSTHAAHILLNETRSVLTTLGGRLMILGELGLAGATFGRWDVVSPRGAVLVNLDENESPLSATNLSPAGGVHIARGGRLASVLATHAIEHQLSGAPAFLPTTELVLVYSARSAAQGDVTAGLVFSIAARRCTHEHRWHEAFKLIRMAGKRRPLVAAARRWNVILPGFASRSALGTIVSSLTKHMPIV